jgi:hypothetical protein
VLTRCAHPQSICPTRSEAVGVASDAPIVMPLSEDVEVRATARHLPDALAVSRCCQRPSASPLTLSLSCRCQRMSRCAHPQGICPTRSEGVGVAYDAPICHAAVRASVRGCRDACHRKTSARRARCLPLLPEAVGVASAALIVVPLSEDVEVRASAKHLPDTLAVPLLSEATSPSFVCEA